MVVQQTSPLFPHWQDAMTDERYHDAAMLEVREQFRQTLIAALKPLEDQPLNSAQQAHYGVLKSHLYLERDFKGKPPKWWNEVEE